MRPPAHAPLLCIVATLAFGTTIEASASSIDDIDLDALLAEYCEEKEGSPDAGDPIRSSFQAPIVEACRQSHRFDDAVWSLSLNLRIPVSAGVAFLRGSLIENALWTLDDGPSEGMKDVEHAFRKALSQSPESEVLRDRLLVFFIEWVPVNECGAALVDIVQNDPDPRALALHLSDGLDMHTDGLAIVIAAALRKAPEDAELLWRLARTSSSHPLRAASYRRALKSAANKSCASTPELETTLAANWVATLLDGGLAESALIAFDGLAARIREGILGGYAGPLDDPFRFYQGNESSEVLVRSLCLAASLETEDVGEPRGPDSLPGDLCASLRDDPYLERMVDQSAEDPYPLIEAAESLEVMERGRVAAAVWLRAYVAWLVREGYPEAARDSYPVLIGQLEGALRSAPHALVLDLLPSDLQEDCDHVRHEISDLLDRVRRREKETKASALDGARAIAACFPGPSPVPPDIAAPLISKSLGRTRLLSLDPGSPASESEPQDTAFEDRRRLMSTWIGRYRFPEGFLPFKVEVGVPSASGSREVDESVAAVGLSDVIATGPYAPELSLIRSDDGAATWSAPVETGLSFDLSSRVLPGSSLPLISEGALQVEVLADPHTADAPGARRLARVTIPLSMIERDEDGDGLTDLLEEKLMTDPERADTDGDELDDAEDPLPLIPLSPSESPTALETFVAALLPRFCDVDPPVFLDSGSTRESWIRLPEKERSLHDRSCAIVHDRAPFRSMMLNKRVMVLTEEEAGRARSKFGSFNAVEIVSFFMDRKRNRGILKWKRGWIQPTLKFARVRGSLHIQEP